MTDPIASALWEISPTVTAIAALAYGEAAARAGWPCPAFLMPGEAIRVLVEAFTLLMTMSIAMGALMTPVQTEAEAIARMANLAVPALAIAVAMACAIDARARRRRAIEEIRSILADDVEFRTGMAVPDTVTIERDVDGDLEVSHHMAHVTERAIDAVHRRHAHSLPLKVKIGVHPLPRSATLRAAIAARGLDPMPASTIKNETMTLEAAWAIPTHS